LATVTEPDAVLNEAASLPDESCIAAFDVDESEDGAVYATDTDCPGDTADANVNTTVEPVTATLLTDRDAPATVTAKFDAFADVVDNASENCKINCVPAEFTAAALSIGEVVSGPKLNPPETETGLLLSVSDWSPSCPLRL
jgi:hypothetical protein